MISLYAGFPAPNSCEQKTNKKFVGGAPHEQLKGFPHEQHAGDREPGWTWLGAQANLCARLHVRLVQ